MQKAEKQEKAAELDEFNELMKEVKALPSDQKRKVTFFAQGVIAATAAGMEAAKHEA